MIKTKKTILVILVVLGVVSSGICTALSETAIDKVSKTVVIVEKQNVLTVQIVDGKVVATSVSCPDPANCECGTGIIEDLAVEFKNTKGTPDTADDVPFPFIKAVDGAIIKTDDPGGTMGPGCTWFFWGGRWWYICD